MNDAEELDRYHDARWPDDWYIYRVAGSRRWRVSRNRGWSSCHTPDRTKAIALVTEWVNMGTPVRDQ